MHIFKQSAFRNGFSAGFASPYNMLFGDLRRYNVGKQNLVAVSWRQVGEAVRGALQEDKAKYGEIASVNEHEARRKRK